MSDNTITTAAGDSVPSVLSGTRQAHVEDWPIAGDSAGRTAPHLHVQHLSGGAGEHHRLDSAAARLLVLENEAIAELHEDLRKHLPDREVREAPRKEEGGDILGRNVFQQGADEPPAPPEFDHV